MSKHRDFINYGLQLLFITLLFFLPLFKAKSASAAVIWQERTIVRPNVIVSAVIGIPKMTLWGYGPPKARIELSGVGVNQTIISDATGYYSFDLVYIPIDSFPELCLTAIDENQRVTPPTCIPKIPAGNYFYSIGPVILPPTLSLSTAEMGSTTQVSAQGETIPNSTVEIKLGRPGTNFKASGFQLVESVRAFYIPSYSVNSDANGAFSFNMPTQNTTWRVFAVTEFEGGSKSPKSNTIKFVSLAPFISFLQKLIAFLKTLLTWPRILLLEIFIILLLFFPLLLILGKKRKRTKPKSCKINYQNYSNIIEEYQNYLNKKFN